MNGSLNSVYQKYEPAAHKIATLLAEEMQHFQIPALTISLLAEGQTFWSQAFGFIDLENRIPATPEHIFRMGSITKVFTTTAVMRMVDQGLVDLDKPFKQYIPEFEVRSRFGNSQPITVRHLMNHQSGLPKEFLYNYFPETQFSNFSELLAGLKNIFVAYPPGNMYKYSNLGIDLLGLLIERISGLTYAGYMQKEFFIPLEMSSSSMLLNAEVRQKIATGYFADYKTRQLKKARLYDIGGVPSGNLYSTAQDLNKFLLFHLQGGEVGGRQLIRRETLQEMYLDRYPNPRNIEKVGCAWDLDKLALPAEAGMQISKMGGVDGFNSLFGALLERGLGVSVAVNTDGGEYICKKVIQAALSEMLEIERKDLPSLTPKKEKVESKTDKPVLDQANRQVYQGRYGSIAIYFDIADEADGLNLLLFGQKIHLQATDLTHYFARDFQINFWGANMDQIYVEFLPEKDGTVPLMRVETPVGPIMARKVEPRDPAPEIWQRLIGKYNDPYLSDVEISLQDGFMIFSGTLNRIVNPVPILLQPLSDLEFITVGGPYDGEAVWFELRESGEILLHYDDGVFKKV